MGCSVVEVKPEVRLHLRRACRGQGDFEMAELRSRREGRERGLVPGPMNRPMHHTRRQIFPYETKRREGREGSLPAGQRGPVGEFQANPRRDAPAHVQCRANVCAGQRWDLQQARDSTRCAAATEAREVRRQFVVADSARNEADASPRSGQHHPEVMHPGPEGKSRIDGHHALLHTAGTRVSVEALEGPHRL